MSASKDKKLRKQLADSGMDKKAIAAAEEERKRKASNLKIVIAIIAIVVVVALAFLINSSLLSKHTTAVEINGEKYTVAQTNFYYSNAYSNFYSNYYYFFQYGYGPFDTSTSLSDQLCDESYADEDNYFEGYTWHDYFMDSAIQTMGQVQMMCDQAEAAGFTMPEESQEEYDSAIASLESSWSSNGYSSLEQFLTLNYGEGVTEDLFKTEMYRIYLASAYSEYLYDSYDLSADELDSYYAEHADELDNITFAYYSAADEATAQEIVDALAADVTAVVETASEETASAETASAETASTEASDEAAAPETEEDTVVAALNSYLSENYDGASATELTYTGENISSIYSEDMAAWLLSADRAADDTTVIAQDDGTAYVVVFENRDNNDYLMADFRHILINAVDGDEDGTYTDEEIAAAHDSAEEIYAEWQAGEATEESFAELADEYSEDTGSNTNGGLYEDVYKGEMVDGIDEWLFADGRAAGDTAVIDNAGSYTGTHVVYFVGNSELTYAQSLADSDLRNEMLQNFIDENMANYTTTTSHLGQVGTNH